MAVAMAEGRPADGTGLEVRVTTAKGRSVFARRPYSQGETVVTSRRVSTTTERSVRSIQYDDQVHIYMDEPALLLNHACDPNTGIANNEKESFNFIALRDIDAGEEITWDYETTEWDLVGIFDCQCEATQCRGQLRGFPSLDQALVHSYGAYIADYIKRFLAREEGSRESGAASLPATAVPPAG